MATLTHSMIRPVLPKRSRRQACPAACSSLLPPQPATTAMTTTRRGSSSQLSAASPSAMQIADADAIQPDRRAMTEGHVAGPDPVLPQGTDQICRRASCQRIRLEVEAWQVGNRLRRVGGRPARLLSRPGASGIRCSWQFPSGLVGRWLSNQVPSQPPRPSGSAASGAQWAVARTMTRTTMILVSRLGQQRARTSMLIFTLILPSLRHSCEDACCRGWKRFKTPSAPGSSRPHPVLQE